MLCGIYCGANFVWNFLLERKFYVTIFFYFFFIFFYHFFFMQFCLLAMNFFLGIIFESVEKLYFIKKIFVFLNFLLFTPQFHS